VCVCVLGGGGGGGGGVETFHDNIFKAPNFQSHL